MKKKIWYDRDTDYQALINRAVDRGDLFAAARYEQQRNQKIEDLDAAGENIWKATATDLYSKYLKKPHYNGQKEAAEAETYRTDREDSAETGSGREEEAGETARPAADPFAEAAGRILRALTRREGFSYDPEADPLADVYRQTYDREGQRALEDALAALSAQAGGVNSYAVTAAQQQNDYYSAQMADRIPELYQLAYDVYRQEGDALLQLLKAVR